MMKIISFILTFMPGLGAIMAPIRALGAAIWSFLSMVLEGLTKIVSNPITLVACGAVAGLCFAYGVHVGFDLDGRRAVAAIEACNVRVAQIESKHNNLVEIGVKAAHEAEDNLSPLPEDLTEACKRSASCRSRGKL